MKRLLAIFESRFASILCVLFAVINRIIFTTLFSEIGRDAKVQITVAKNFLAGKGFGVTKYFTNDLTTPVFDKHQLFPPGFSFSIIPFLKMFGNDYLAVRAFDIIIAIAFVFAVRYLGKTAGLSTGFYNILTLIAGCSQYSFIMSGTSSDVAGLTFLLLGLSIVIRTIAKSTKQKPVVYLLYAFIFFLPAFFRYMYIPVSILFPIIIFCFGVYYKNKLLKTFAVWSGGFVVLFISLMLFLSNLYGGNSVHVIDTGRGIFFDQLVHWYPYIPASFINLDFFAQLITKISRPSYTNVFKAFEIINVLFLFCLTFLLFRTFRSLRRSQNSRTTVFILSGATIAISILLLLAYFSLTYKPQLYGIYLWNYNYESRYFAFIYVFLPIVLLILVSYPKKNAFFKLFLLLIPVLLFVEVIHGIYFNAKIVTKQKDVMVLKDRVADYRQFSTMLDSVKAKYPDRELLISASDQFFLYSASEKGYKAIFDYTNLNSRDLKVEKKSILLFPVHETDAWLMKEYLDRKKPITLDKIAGTVFFLEEVDP